MNEFRRRKKEITDRFRSEMGLLVDAVRQGRATTNDGNTSRRVNVRLIHRLSVILKALSCGYDIDTEAFRKYAFETARMYVKLYSWFYMPASVHKIIFMDLM
ncbi:hypothetical protein PR048_008060 [Dryococelus australis]|uniref:Uncharacterized protein n=1 Tax=Dryococelus australis TaxID=614101 RepID=A0ABQ9HW07_9NEOP|nr:hypothetical protein PR048_008060 [Dryococelus australis]